MSLDNKALQQQSVTRLKGVGPAMAEKLAKLGIHSIADVLFHLPLRYQDRTRISPIGGLQLGQDVVIEGVVKVANVVFGKRRSLLCRLQDGTGTISLRFFHFNASQKQQLQADARIRCYGEVRRGASGFELYHPEYQVVNHDETLAVAEQLTPIYPSSDGLHQASWQKITSSALAILKGKRLTEYLSAEDLALANMQSPPLVELLATLHRPPPDINQSLIRSGMHPYQRRLAFEELLAHHLSLLFLRATTQQLGAPALKPQLSLREEFLKQLPFALTAAQQRVCEEINRDLQQVKPTLRLVQGDVGSGKTVVAALAALQAIGNGYQVALMAPTELLAEQHFQQFSQWFEPLGLNMAWLSGKVKGKKRQQQLTDIAEHNADIVIGTHALFQAEVLFAKLGLAIIDEQHRFGVHQRLALKEKASASVGHPHQLIMTATPIPRTLAMSAYADLDTSIIDELPPGRTPVNTVVIDSAKRPALIHRIEQACLDGKQVYWVCTLIEESETLSAQAAEQSYQLLQEQLPNVRVALLHGRMKAKEKTTIMAAYKQHEIDLLVATTVIEVGVDVPNASLMIIENAERLGLSQLHQLRGRVGRGSEISHCLLMYKSPLSKLGRERLGIMRETTDGFEIAERDLALRGPGELLGTRQTGLLEMRIADLVRDEDLLDAVTECAEKLFQKNPETCRALIQRWLPNREHYAQV